MRYDLVYVAVGAVAGALLRYATTGRPLFWGSLPTSVLIVNVVGSFILGVTMAAVQRLGIGSGFVLLIGVGFCGSLTTMSSFAFETAGLADAGLYFVAAGDVLLNVGLSILVIYLGRALVILLVGVG